MNAKNKKFLLFDFPFEMDSMIVQTDQAFDSLLGVRAALGIDDPILIIRADRGEMLLLEKQVIEDIQQFLKNEPLPISLTKVNGKRLN